MNVRSIAARTLLVGVPLLVAVVAISRADVGGPQGGRGATSYDADGRAVGTTPTAASRPNLIVLVVDTLRADAVEPRSGGRLMPHLARIASEGAWFPDASSTAPWTMPSVGSLLTGCLPTELGLLDARNAPSLPSAVTTYAEVLSQSFGYDTAAFVDAPWFTGPTALLQGFRTSSLGFHLQGLDAFVGPWAGRREAAKPFFLLLHTNEAHAPYGAKNHPWPSAGIAHSAELPARAPEPWEATRAAFLDVGLRDVLAQAMGPAFSQSVVHYIGEGYAEQPRPELASEFRVAYEDGLRWVDTLIAGAVQRLEALGLLENTLLVVTGDHGESFGEHGYLGHGRQVYDEMIRVPVVMRGPAPFRGGRMARGSVSVMDVMPTFLDWIGAPPVQGTEGVSMLPVLRGESAGRPVLAEEELSFANLQRPVDATLASLRSAEWKYVITRDRRTGAVEQELYDLRRDPGEESNLLAGATASPDLPPDLCSAIHALKERVTAGDRDLAPGARTEPVVIARAPCE